MTQTHINYDFPDWVRGLEIFHVASLTLNKELKFTVVNFSKGPRKIFTVREFYDLRDILADYGLIAPVDESDLLKGFEWSKEGRYFLRQVIDFYSLPHFPTDK